MESEVGVQRNIEDEKRGVGGGVRGGKGVKRKEGIDKRGGTQEVRESKFVASRPSRQTGRQTDKQTGRVVVVVAGASAFVVYFVSADV